MKELHSNFDSSIGSLLSIDHACAIVHAYVGKVNLLLYSAVFTTVVQCLLHCKVIEAQLDHSRK